MGGINHQKWVVYYCYTHITCLDSTEMLCSLHPGMSAPPSDVKLALQRTSSTLLQQIEAGHSHGKHSISHYVILYYFRLDYYSIIYHITHTHTHTYIYIYIYTVHKKCTNDFQRRRFELDLRVLKIVCEIPTARLWKKGHPNWSAAEKLRKKMTRMTRTS